MDELIYDKAIQMKRFTQEFKEVIATTKNIKNIKFYMWNVNN